MKAIKLQALPWVVSICDSSIFHADYTAPASETKSSVAWGWGTSGHWRGAQEGRQPAAGQLQLGDGR